MVNVGVWIQALRKERGYTQKQLGDMLGFSSITIQNYEKGRRKPSIDVLYNISKVLGVDAGVFFKDIKLANDLSKQAIQKSYIEENLLSLSDSVEEYISYLEIENKDLSKEKLEDLIKKINKLIECETCKQKIQNL